MTPASSTPLSSGFTLGDDFQRYFHIDLAKSDDQLSAVYSVRYRVYCEEFGYEPADRFPEQRETDEFDKHSVHCLVTHSSTGVPAGCVRLVLCDADAGLPMEKYCSQSIEEESIRRLQEHRAMSCEFSRLAVDGSFRRRSGEHASRFGKTRDLGYSPEELRTFPLIAVATYLSGFAASDLLGRHHVYAMMEPFLPRMLSRSGIRVNRIGDEMDYHGLRAPYVASTPEVVSGMKPELRELYDAIHSRFEAQLADAGATLEQRETAFPDNLRVLE